MTNDAAPETAPTAGEPALADTFAVVVAFRPDDIAVWLASGTAPPELVEVGDALTAAGLTLEPLHPGATVPELAAWFRVPVSGPAEAERALALLRASPAVVGAFVKPPEAPPG
jgi:hypothetical protein